MKDNNKIIIYDDTCPMCAAYTNIFVKTGLIDKHNRITFSTIEPQILSMINLNKSVNEIPLVDKQTKQVWYGTDAILEVLDQKIPFVKTIGNIKVVKWLTKKVYKLISYNRRIIVAPEVKAGNVDCTPAFSIKYRIAFIFLFLLFNTFMLFPINQDVLNNSFIHTSIINFQLAHFILVSINILIACTIKRQAAIEYLGQVNMLSLAVILLFVPLILINKYLHIDNADLNNFWMGMLFMFTIKEYYRRMKFAGIFTKYKWVALLNGICITLFLLYLLN